MLGVYLHIPFCLAKCRYCDFTSRPADPALVERYVRALVREVRGSPAAGTPAETIFLGGGTPTILAEAQLAQVLAAAREAFPPAPGAEISIEANPGTVTGAKAERLLDLGVNRVSLGVQSLDDAMLARLGRRHSAAEAVAAFRTLRAAGFANIGCDLIHSLPGQTPAAWERDLARVIDLGPEHLSLYALSVEAGTPFAAERARGSLPLPTEEEELAMLGAAGRLAGAAGYEHYEISNFARPGSRCRHNLRYWTMGDYRGFGAGAHSFLRAPAPVRAANQADPEVYLGRVEAGESPEAMRETLTPRQFAGEAFMLGLRLREGVAVDLFAREFGGSPAGLFPEAVARGTGRGWLETAGGRLRLTEEGLLFSNVLFRDLF